MACGSPQWSNPDNQISCRKPPVLSHVKASDVFAMSVRIDIDEGESGSPELIYGVL